LFKGEEAVGHAYGDEETDIVFGRHIYGLGGAVGRGIRAQVS
jgi:hypothetical protein